MDEIAYKLDSLLRKNLRFVEKEQEIPPDARLDRLGLDSMSAINILMDIETTFSTQIPDEMLNAATFQTPSTLRRALASIMESKNS